MSNRKQSSTVGYTFMNSDFEKKIALSLTICGRILMLLVDMPVVCRGSRYNFVTGSQYNKKCTNSMLCHPLPQY